MTGAAIYSPASISREIVRGTVRVFLVSENGLYIQSG